MNYRRIAKGMIELEKMIKEETLFSAEEALERENQEFWEILDAYAHQESEIYKTSSYQEAIEQLNREIRQSGSTLKPCKYLDRCYKNYDKRLNEKKKKK